MLHQAGEVSVAWMADGFVELSLGPGAFAQGGHPLRRALALIDELPGLRGLMLNCVPSSCRSDPEQLRWPHAELVDAVRGLHEALIGLEDLPVPSVAVLAGDTAGASLEVALACAWRVMAADARAALPAVSLGRVPHLGGTVRLARIASPRTALEWIADDGPRDAQAARSSGIVDIVCERAELRATALACLARSASGQVDWRARQERKRAPLGLSASELDDLVERWRSESPAASAPRPAAAADAVSLIRRAAALDREGALALEAETFARLMRQPGEEPR